MIYKDSSKPVDERVSDLLSKMTLIEKIAQMTSAKMSDMIIDPHNVTFSTDKAKANVPNGCGYINRVGGGTDLKPMEMAALINQIQKYFIENTRLGIPAFMLTEATSGVLSRDHTVFPQNIGAGAMFDDGLVYEMGNAVREEMLSTGERFALAPVVDVIRDHRYGRYEESYGEDVYLVSQCGVAYTKGLQSDCLKNGIAATLKHYVAQGISDGGRNCAPIHATEREILDQYAVPFEAAIREADAACVMAAYHEWADTPCHVSDRLLKDFLHKELGFNGLLVSDGNGIQLIKTYHDYCESLEETIPLAMTAGIEMELDYMYKKHLKDMVSDGRVSMELVDRAVSKILALKFNLGLFDAPYVDTEKVRDTVCSRSHRDLALKMARESLTLLKNESAILPLSPDIKTIAVVGPLADKKEFAYSDYAYPAHIELMYHLSEGRDEEEIIATSLFYMKKNTRFEDLFNDTKTVYEAIKEAVSPETEVVCAPGLKDTYNYRNDPDFNKIGEAVQAAAGADVIIAVCGDTSGIGWDNDCGESVDRVEITLPKEQRELLRELKKLNKPIVLVLSNGRPLELSYENENMNAILEAWRPGMEGGTAIAEALFGKYNPGGRLPVSLPKSIGQLPVYYSQHSTGKTQFWRKAYLEMDTEPLFSFGFGLSYTSFSYESIDMVQDVNGIHVKVKVKNNGEFDGDEVVQIYARKRFTSVKQPERELKAYKRVSLKRGQQAVVEFTILFDSLCYHNINNELGLEDCTLDIMAGSSSRHIHKEQSFRLQFEDGIRRVGRRVFTNPSKVEYM